MTVKAAIVEDAGAPPIVDGIELAAIQGDELRVRMVASGICHTDLSVASGLLPSAFPAVLGHEGAGVVEEAGPDVRRFRSGDRVVSPSPTTAATCRYCELGSPRLCVERDDRRERYGGSAVAQALGTGTFAEAIVVRERSVVGVPDDVPLDVAAVTGYAAVTGLGVVLNVVKVRAARLTGAERIVAVDRNERRRDSALACGATDFAPPDPELLRELEHAASTTFSRPSVPRKRCGLPSMRPARWEKRRSSGCRVGAAG